MVVVPLERRNPVIVAGLEEGASLYHFVPVVDIADSPKLAAEIVAVPPHLLNSVIAVGVEAEEVRREVSHRHFVDVREAANAPERVVEEGRREVSTRHFADARKAANNPEKTAANIVAPSEHLLCCEKQNAKHQRHSTRGLVAVSAGSAALQY